MWLFANTYFRGYFSHCVKIGGSRFQKYFEKSFIHPKVFESLKNQMQEVYS